MNTRFGPVIEATAFESPFDEIVTEFLDNGRLLYESHREYVKPEWKKRFKLFRRSAHAAELCVLAPAST